jgi:hypothetical protein
MPTSGREAKEFYAPSARNFSFTAGSLVDASLLFEVLTELKKSGAESVRKGGKGAAASKQGLGASLARLCPLAFLPRRWSSASTASAWPSGAGLRPSMTSSR